MKLTKEALLCCDLRRNPFLIFSVILIGGAFGGLIIWAVDFSGRSRKLNAGNTPSKVSSVFDIGPSLQQKGRSVFWKPQTLALGDSGFVAHVATCTYLDENAKTRDFDVQHPRPDYFTIGVQKPRDSASYVYFQRDLRIDEVPDDFVSKPIEEIVTYEPTSRKVSFTIGTQRSEYTLPK
jgi:hypothetical protein